MIRFLLVSVVVFSQAVFAEPLPSKPPVPKSNPMTAAKIELGKQLYFDTRLSRTGNISCNTCHNVMSTGADYTPGSFGVDAKVGDRNSPTVWNAAFMSVQFWDGRAPSLEEQAKGPLTNPIEMGMENHDAVMARVKSIPGYAPAFKKAFPGVKDPMTIDHLAQAIASYERTLITPNSKYDRFARGNKSAFNAREKRGWDLVNEVGCMSCHSGPNFAGPKLPEGSGFFMKFPTFPGSEYDSKYALMDDPGRMKATNKPEDKGMWRVASWRNVAITAPYFHNGKVKTLEEAVKVMARAQLNKTLTEDQVQDIVAFLNTLTGEFPKQQMPRLPDMANKTSL